MTRTPLTFCLVLIALGLRPPAALGQDAKAVAVEPGDLMKKPELVGKDVVIDDRVGRYQYHPTTKGIDQIYLRRAPDVPCELPERLRPVKSPTLPGVIVRGTLRRDGDRYYVEVSSFDPVPSDIDRLTRGIAILPRTDVARRTAWAAWGARRAKEFGDDVLAKRAREIEQDAITVEAERPAGRDPQGHWLALADRARESGASEPEPAALAHRAFRLGLVSAKTADEFEKLVTKIEAYLPISKFPIQNPPDLSRWEKGYQADPWASYRSAPADARATFDRRLWVDAVTQSLERRALADPSSASLLALAEEAARRLPDRPKLAEAFLDRGVGAGAKDVANLRQREVDSLAALYRDRLHQPEKALALYRAWLDDQRLKRLSRRDIDGRIALAKQYRALLDDRGTAVGLLRDAWTIDPASKDLREAFLSWGYRQVNGAWVEAPTTRAEDAPAKAPVASTDEPRPKPDDPEVVVPAAGPAARGDSLRGATPQEVRARLGGKPDRVVRSSTRGQLTEQWIYFGKGQDQYINFVRKAGDSRSRVVAYYALPKGLTDTSLAP